ncbi:MAG: Cys-tRNA(Pro) deacylase [Ectothiorhodospiraceae bacterium]|nr:Cys-tRNA(Pro) deacylase [Chromatiales bacterium]MCP5154684.1 Cys-tRNA(Pro) deacylase [Ectothiorhodospiraceae bacterium]
MTPAIRAAEAAGVPHQVVEYAHDPRARSYGLEAAQATGQPPERVLKTLLARLDDGRLVVAVVPVAMRLDLKALASAAGAKRAVMAEPRDAERATGYVVGGISPLGQKRRLPTLIDTSAEAHDRIFVSAGRRGLEIALAPADLRALTEGRFAAIARD